MKPEDKSEPKVSAEQLRQVAVEFYYHWHNMQGTNTAKGFDDWWKVNADKFAALSKPELIEEDIKEPIANALYSTRRFLTTECDTLAEGILAYLRETGYEIVIKDFKAGYKAAKGE